MRYASLACKQLRSPLAVVMDLAAVEHQLGNLTRAEQLYQQAIAPGKDAHTIRNHVLANLGSIALSRGQAARAATLLGAIAEESVAAFKSLFASGFTYEQDVAAAREQLGEAAFAEAWAKGKAMRPEEVIAYARQDNTPSEEPDTPTPPLNAQLQTRTQKTVVPLLNERELEILTLAAEGLSNRGTPERLILALSTVKWYMSEILGKLDAQNRTSAIARARELGL